MNARASMILGGVAALGAVGLAGVAVFFATRPLDDVPAFAGPTVSSTRAGSIAIVTRDTRDGRQVTAYALPLLTPMWKAPPGRFRVVRCAGELRQPCGALVEPVGNDEPSAVAIDPATGTLGDTWWSQPALADLAISPSGEDLLVCDGKSSLALEIELSTKDGVDLHATVPQVTHVAYGADGKPVLTGDEPTPLP